MRTTKRTMTRAEIHARALDRKMRKDPYYQYLRNTEYGFGLGHKDAVETVKNFDALKIAVEHTKADQKLDCKEGR